MLMPEGNRKKILDLLDKYPERQEQIFEGMRQRGIPTDWINEERGTNLATELRELRKGVTEGLTFGLKSREVSPYASTIDLPIFGKTSPSRFVGNVIGSLPIGLGAYGLAGKAVARAGLTGGAARAAQVIGAEAPLGAAQGLIESDGDLKEAAKHAAVWTSVGLLSEGAYQAFGNALKKMRDNEALSKAERKAYNEYMQVKDKVGGAYQPEVDNVERVTSAFDIDDPPMLSAPPTILERTTKEMHRLLDDLQSGSTTLEEATRSFGTMLSESVGMFSDKGLMKEGADGRIHALLSNLMSEYATKVSDGRMTAANAVLQIRDRVSSFRKSKTTPTVEDDIPVAKDNRPQSEEQLIGEANRNTPLRKYADFDVDEGGTVNLPDVDDLSPEGASITEDQTDMIFNLERLLRDEGDMVSTAGEEVSKMSMRQGRQRIQQLKQQLSQKRNAEDNKAFTSFLQYEADRSMLIDPDDITSGVDVGRLPKIEREHYERLRESLRQNKEVGYNEFINPKVHADLYKEPGMLWFWKVLPPNSRRGLSKNPLAKARVIDTMNTLEKIGRDSKQYLDRVKAISQKLVGGSQTKDFLMRPFSANAQQRIDDGYNLKVKLIQALDSSPREANAILSSDTSGRLTEAYSETRLLLDELADMMGLQPNERITNYFPHLFDGRVGSFRANRILNELGPQSQSIPGLMPSTEGYGLPRQKAFFAQKQRQVNDPDFVKDFDSVLYTYVRGAIDKVYMDPLMRRVSNTVNALPTAKDGKRLYASDELRSWFSYVIGAPTSWKHVQANWWRDNETFNRWVDGAVSFLGDAQDKSLLSRVRQLPIKEINKQEEEALVSFFDKLVRDADTFEKVDGPNGEYYKSKKASVKKYRAQLALMVDDMRSALSDPARKPLILERLYTLMVVNKLGFSLSHGLINATQYITNTYPLLGLKYAARGVKNYGMQMSPDARIGNRLVNDIIEESGVKASFYESTEFRAEGKGLFKLFDDIALKPATVSEDFLRTSTLLGQYEKSIDEGLSHALAMAQAKATVRKTQFVYNRAGSPPLFHGPLVRFLLMFKTYPIHQINFSAELLEDALNGNPGPFYKHLLAYLTMAGVGATLLGKEGADTRFGELTEHPAVGLPQDLQRRGLLETLGGPPSSTLLEILHGQYVNALGDVTEPVISRRVNRAIEKGDPMMATGLR